MQRKIIKLLVIASFSMVFIYTTGNVISKVMDRQNSMTSTSIDLFMQIRNIMDLNDQELRDAVKELDETCKSRTKAASLILQNYDVKTMAPSELREIAHVVESDEINIFDATGKIINGSVEKYFGFTMDDGEQISFFKPLLTNKSLVMIQELTPNTVEAKPMQYAARWSENRDYIVQIGYEPRRVLEATAHNELPYVFSLLTDSPDTKLLAVSANTGMIVGSNMRGVTGSKISDLGLDISDIDTVAKGVKYKNPAGERCFGVFIQTNDLILGRITKNKTLYAGIVMEACSLLMYSFIFFGLFIFLINFFLNRYVVQSINETNDKLQKITEGNLNTKIDVDSTPEFVTLSKFLNNMVSQLRRDLEEDSLTGLFSRRAFYSEIERIYADHELSKKVAVCMVDADGLKKVNDKFGHETGDVYLRKVGDLLSEHSCPQKIVARLGGDEFGLILFKSDNGPDFEAMLEEYKHIRENVNIVISAENQVTVGFSIGMAYAPADGDNYHIILKRADERMYQDKMERKQERK